MARLREPEAATTGDAVPEHLQVCFVEDWVDPETEPVPNNVLSLMVCGIDNTEHAWASLARRRWLRAREHWCEERGMTERDLMARHHGHMRPRWRSSSSSSPGTPPDETRHQVHSLSTPHPTPPHPLPRGPFQWNRRVGERSRAQHHR
jgi:hypothetical protein